MKKLNWQKILNILFAALLAALGTNEVKQMIDEAQPVEAGSALAAVPGTPVYYVVNVQVIWKKANTALPDAQYLAVMHQVRLDRPPNLGSGFNAVRDGFVNGKIKAPVDGFTPIYAYSAELVSRIGIPLQESGDKPIKEELETE